MHMCVYVCVVCACASVGMWMVYVCARVCTSWCVYVSACVCVFVCVCDMHVYMIGCVDMHAGAWIWMCT